MCGLPVRGRRQRCDEGNTHLILVSPYDPAASTNPPVYRQQKGELIRHFRWCHEPDLRSGDGHIDHYASTGNRSVAVENCAELAESPARMLSFLDTHLSEPS